MLEQGGEGVGKISSNEERRIAEEQARSQVHDEIREQQEGHMKEGEGFVRQVTDPNGGMHRPSKNEARDTWRNTEAGKANRAIERALMLSSSNPEEKRELDRLLDEIIDNQYLNFATTKAMLHSKDRLQELIGHRREERIQERAKKNLTDN